MTRLAALALVFAFAVCAVPVHAQTTTDLQRQGLVTEKNLGQAMKGYAERRHLDMTASTAPAGRDDHRAGRSGGPSGPGGGHGGGNSGRR